MTAETEMQTPRSMTREGGYPSSAKHVPVESRPAAPAGPAPGATPQRPAPRRYAR